MNNEWTKGIGDLRAENKELLEALKCLVNAYCVLVLKEKKLLNSEFEDAINNGKSIIAKVGE
ncbi:hypothetical protein KD27_05890 [Smithella sp. D17]|nr:hypothetical protein KD27_05890 [Smithella sp. D17]